MRCDAAPGVMLKAVLVAPAGPVALAASVYPVPTLSILTFANVATPLTAATLVVPASVPPPGLAAIASATLPLNGVAVVPCASRAVTWTAGGSAGPAVSLGGWARNTSAAALRALPAVVLPGCTANRGGVAPPGETWNAAFVGDGSPVAAAVGVYPVPALSTLRSPNVATPATAATVFVPVSAPPPGFAPMATATFPVKPVATRPAASPRASRGTWRSPSGRKIGRAHV